MINSLPIEVVEKIKSSLKAFDECNVVFENGKYHVRTFTCLQSSYSDDYKFIGKFKKDEVFTKEEQDLNYIEEFRSYPYPMTLEIKNGVDRWKLIRQYEEGEITFEQLRESLGV